MTLAPNANGKVEAVVGSQGFAYNVNPKKKLYRAVGYPFNKFDTEVMWECIDKFAGYDPGYRGPGPKPIGIGCDMLGGASGGGWAIPGKALGQYYLNSVTSFGYDAAAEPPLRAAVHERRREDAEGRRQALSPGRGRRAGAGPPCMLPPPPRERAPSGRDRRGGTHGKRGSGP